MIEEGVKELSQRITEEQKNIAIEKYRETGMMRLAAEAAGVNRKTLQREMSREKDFRQQMSDAKEDFLDGLEHEGDESTKGKINSGAITWRMFRLNAERPDKYRPRVDHKIDANVKIITGVPRPARQEEKSDNVEKS